MWPPYSVATIQCGHYTVCIQRLWPLYGNAAAPYLGLSVPGSRQAAAQLTSTAAAATAGLAVNPGPPGLHTSTSACVALANLVLTLAKQQLAQQGCYI